MHSDRDDIEAYTVIGMIHRDDTQVIHRCNRDDTQVYTDCKTAAILKPHSYLLFMFRCRNCSLIHVY